MGSMPRPRVVIAWFVLAGALVWAYASPIAALAYRWWNEADYVYGFLVPPFAVYLLWARRDMVDSPARRGSWWGLAFLAIAAGLRWASAYYFYALMDPFSLIPCVAGVVLLIGGWRLLRWAWPSIVFLAFMIPLPGFLADLLSQPLQRIGTIASTYLIQTLGIPAISQGNVILLTEAEVGVAEACSGLRMLMLFSAVCVGAAFIMRRGFVERGIIIISALPIAVAANVVRITVTSVLHETVGHGVADAVFHDLAGWFMMPLAVVMLWLEMAVLASLLVEAPQKTPPPAKEFLPVRPGNSASSQGVEQGGRAQETGRIASVREARQTGR
jgi:exosortase